MEIHSGLPKRTPVSKRWLWWGLASIIVLFALVRLYYALTDDFRLANIRHSLPYQAAWAIPQPTPSEELLIQSILSQKFTYLAKGAQSYVFVSADGHYVLKFFKFKHLRPSWFFENAAAIGLFKDYHAKLSARKERKLWGVFRAYKLAYDQDRQESGLLFIQLNTESNPHHMVTLRDKIGIERTLDLQNISFILQQRGETLRTVLDALLQHDDIAMAQERVGQLLDLYASEYSKGMYDHDHGVMRNVGFVDNQPIHLDVGKLSVDEGMRQKSRAKEDVLLVADKIREWMNRHYPQYAVSMSAYIDNKIHQLFDDAPHF